MNPAESFVHELDEKVIKSQFSLCCEIFRLCINDHNCPLLIFEGPVCFSIFALAYLAMTRTYEWFTWIVLASSLLRFFRRNKLAEAIHDRHMCRNCSKTLLFQTSASLKLTVLNPKGRIWTMVAGGGASVIYADTVSWFSITINFPVYNFTFLRLRDIFTKSCVSISFSKFYAQQYQFSLWWKFISIYFVSRARLETWVMHLSSETMLNTVEHLKKMRSCSMQELFLM